MLNLLKLNWLAWVIIAALSIGLGIQTVRLANEQRDHAQTIADHEKDLTTLAKTAAAAALDSLALYQKRTEGVQKEAENAKQLQVKATADAVNAAVAGERLRAKRKANLAASSCPSTTDPATTAERKTTDPALDLFDYVQRRLDEATDRIAAYADSSRIAGKACENSYNLVQSGSKIGVIDETPLNINQALNSGINANQSPSLQEITP